MHDASVSVRTPHGAGTEGLAGTDGLAFQTLKRVDTDQAASQSSANPSAVKDVLWGKNQQAFTPSAPPPTDEEIQALHDFIVESEKLLIVTGAGVSTESGIPDYRSPTGAYSTGFKPMTHQEFVRSAASRQRYWARSYFGWRRFFGTQPNETHRALATLEERGRVRGGMITQNVDRLHHACGSSPLELHGTTHHVVCMNCQDLTDRQMFQEKLAATNPQWIDSIEAAERGEDVLAGTPGLQRPDGDVEIGEEFLRKGLFKVPVCENCGADTLKPDVVFFGDNVPKWRVDCAMGMVQDSDAMLVVGSSLMVLSAYRLARAAADASTPIAILNVGPTRADDLATLRVGARSGEVLPRLLNCGSLTIPT
ncbi:sirtuin [Klebsormidium nitens]|uniref:NAD-dependent protein deacylase n=1 Tax=Klebsormidium nitens TaxID=105231 RepID=A0A1Y1IJB7_KLENI|nr:sirtuin [Klebsormidium nitens]|eukprot:GAQ88208.1 sirtuin [Klebsormidium nitens]